MRSIVAIVGLFVVTAAAACGSKSSPETGACSACPDGYVCGADNRCWLVGTSDGGGTSAGGSGGFGGGADAGAADAPGAEPDVPIAVSVGGAGGSVVGATVFIGGTGGTTGWLGGAMSTGGGITTGGTSGVGRGIDAGVAGAGSGTSAGGSGGFGGGADARVADALGAEPDVPIVVSAGGAGGIIAVGGSVVGATVFIGGTGGTTGWLGGAMSTGGGIATGGTSGMGRGMDAGVAGAGSGGNGGVLGSVGTNCGIKTANLTRQPADLLLVLDRSGSLTSAMDSSSVCAAGSITCQQRWATIESGLDAVLSDESGNVNWGLQLFNSDGKCGVAAQPEVPIGPGSAAAIQAIIAGIIPNGSTPTRTAVNAGVTYLQTLTDTNGRYILLATDGEPNCLNGSGGSAGTSDVAGTVAAITAAAAAGIKVYVIGVGPETGNLDNFAVAGGTDHYYPALSPQDLNAALAAIVGTVAGCTFNLGKAPPDPSNVVIQFNGDKGLRAPHDTTHANGWDYTSTSHITIQFYGSWCDNVTNGTYTSAEALMGCPGTPIH